MGAGWPGARGGGSGAGSTDSSRRPSVTADSAGGIELDEHVRPFVRRPEIAVVVEAHGVRERKAVEILADFAQVRAIGTELEQLRRRFTMHRTAAPGAAEDKEMLGGAHRDAGDFAEVHARNRGD